MIAQIEQAIIDCIKQASDSGALGYKLAKVSSYGGEFSDASVKGLLKDFPAVMVMFDGASQIKRTTSSVSIEARFGVFAAARSLRSEVSARRGDSSSVGSYKIVQDLLVLLSNNNFGLEIGELNFERIQLVLAEKSDQSLLSVYGLSFKTSFNLKTLPSDEEMDGLDKFEVFHANWDVPEHGNVSTVLPADGSADATDHVEIPQ